MQLATSGVDSVDALRPVLEENLGKSARGSADVETGMPFGVKAETLERSRKFYAAS